MCVIIYVPKTENISIEELNNAWDTNPDGAGFSIQKDNKVIYERGFMNKADFINKVTEYIGKYNLMLQKDMHSKRIQSYNKSLNMLSRIKKRKIKSDVWKK